jgi:ATP-dependent DNA ligase
MGPLVFGPRGRDDKGAVVAQFVAPHTGQFSAPAAGQQQQFQHLPNRFADLIAGMPEPHNLGRSSPRLCPWVHEIKYDGHRLIVRRDGKAVRLFTCRSNDWTDRYAAKASVQVDSVLPPTVIIFLAPSDRRKRAMISARMIPILAEGGMMGASS